MKVFLGGTCNEDPWREELIPLLAARGIEYFNPVVPDWTFSCVAKEREQRTLCRSYGSNNYCLYVVTSRMTGVYSIAEAVDDSNKSPLHMIFCVLPEGFSDFQLRSLAQVGTMIWQNGGTYVQSLEDVVAFLSTKLRFVD